MTLDRVYFLVQRVEGKPPNVFYAPPATNPRDCWRNGACWDLLEGGDNPYEYVDATYMKEWRKSMRSSGWRAVKLELGEIG